MLKNYLFSTLSLFQPSFSFSFSAAHFFFFSFSWSAVPFSSSLFFLLFLFFWSVALYFSAQNTFFSAQTFFSPKTLFSTQNVFASAQNFFQFSPKLFFLFQFSHSSLLLFSALFFSGSTLSFLFQRLIFFFSLAPFIQDPMFSLAASHLFYLNKSLFYSNLE